MYAVISLKGHQYIVNEGLELTVDKVDGNPGDKIEIEEVIAIFDQEGTDVKVGNPTIAKAKVVAEIMETKKGKKVKIVKFKRKNRYERNMGFRPLQTILKINKIQLNG
ncbi:MAG: 50S ribosomal protein L21 [Candidatus Absconditicoccaceae bacterium]